MYDALKRAREEGEAWLSWKGKRLKLTRPNPDSFPQFAFVQSRRGPVLVELVWKDGLRAFTEKCFFQVQETLADVAELHSK